MKRSPLQRKTRLKARNPKRRQALFVRHFHSTGYVTFVHQQDCVVQGRRAGEACWGPIQAAHTHSRGAGGTYEDVVPICAKHHATQHQVGIASFARYFAVDLKAAAAQTWAQYQKRRGTLE